MSRPKSRPEVSTTSQLWSVSLLSALFAFLAAALYAPRSFAGAGLGGDGDAVGSLPGTHGSGHGQGSHGQADDDQFRDQFSLSMIGDMAQIDALVADYEPGSSGYYIREELDTFGLVRISFVGDVRVELDRALLESSFVAVQLEIGPAFAGGRLQVQAAGKTSLSAAVPGTLPLHLQQLSWSGTLERGVALRAIQSDGQVGNLSLQAKGPGSDRIVLSQQY